MNVLLSIDPSYAEAILSGAKRYEFRRKIFKRKDIYFVYLYANSTVKRIVGSFQIRGIIEGLPKDIWKRCHAHSGISRKKFFEYFGCSKKAYCIKVGKVIRFHPPIDPHMIIRDFTPPQSFSYISKTISHDS
jgi:predicted transcriptional regulator